MYFIHLREGVVVKLCWGNWYRAQWLWGRESLESDSLSETGLCNSIYNSIEKSLAPDWSVNVSYLWWHDSPSEVHVTLEHAKEKYCYIGWAKQFIRKDANELFSQPNRSKLTLQTCPHPSPICISCLVQFGGFAIQSLSSVPLPGNFSSLWHLIFLFLPSPIHLLSFSSNFFSLKSSQRTAACGSNLSFNASRTGPAWLWDPSSCFQGLVLEILSGINQRVSSGEKGWLLRKVRDYLPENSIGMLKSPKSGRVSLGWWNFKEREMSTDFRPRKRETMGMAFKKLLLFCVNEKPEMRFVGLSSLPSLWLEDRSETLHTHHYTTCHGTVPYTQPALKENLFQLLFIGFWMLYTFKCSKKAQYIVGIQELTLITIELKIKHKI